MITRKNRQPKEEQKNTLIVGVKMVKKFKKCKIYKRDKLQEGDRVLRWYEGCGNTISVVEGDPIPKTEAEIRVSNEDFESFKIRGDKNLILKKLNKSPNQRINRLMERENKLRETFG